MKLMFCLIDCRFERIKEPIRVILEGEHTRGAMLSQNCRINIVSTKLLVHMQKELSMMSKMMEMSYRR